MPRVPPVTTATRAIFLPRSLLREPPRRRLPVIENAWRRRGSAALDAHRDAHAAADAERGEPLLHVPLLHLVEERHQDARSGGADRVPQRDRAAVDVDLRDVPAEVLVDRAGLRGERLVRLDELEIVGLPAR